MNSWIQALVAYRASSRVLATHLSLYIPKLDRAMPFALQKTASECDVGFERYRSIGGQLVSQKRNSLKPEKVNNLIFLAKNLNA